MAQLHVDWVYEVVTTYGITIMSLLKIQIHFKQQLKI